MARHIGKSHKLLRVMATAMIHGCFIILEQEFHNENANDCLNIMLSVDPGQAASGHVLVPHFSQVPRTRVGPTCLTSHTDTEAPRNSAKISQVSWLRPLIHVPRTLGQEGYCYLSKRAMAT